MTVEDTHSFNQLEKYVEVVKVTDSAIKGKESTLVKIRDPCNNGNVLVTIRNPKHSIANYANKDKLIDIN